MNELKWMKELKWLNWSEWIKMNEFKWRNWNEWIEMQELKWRNWTEWIEMMNWKKGMETDELPKVVRDLWFVQFYVINYLIIILLTYDMELSLHSRAHFVYHFPRSRGATAETETAATTDGHFTPKNTGFRARKCFQAWIHAFPIAYTFQLLHYDVGLTWWWDS